MPVRWDVFTAPASDSEFDLFRYSEFCQAGSENYSNPGWHVLKRDRDSLIVAAGIISTSVT